MRKLIARSISIILSTTILALVGCGAPMATSLSLQGNRSGSYLAKYTFDDAITALSKIHLEEEKDLLAGLPAIMNSATDEWTQRCIKNLYNQEVATILPKVDPAMDEAIGEVSVKVTIQSCPEVTDKPQLVAYLQGVMDQVSQKAGFPSIKVKLLNRSFPNAFNAGGNTIYLFTGMLSALRSEAELAGIMAHEAAHAKKRHVLQKFLNLFSAASVMRWVQQTKNVSVADMEMADSYVKSLPSDMNGDPDFVLSYLQGKVSPAVLATKRFKLNETFAAMSLIRDAENEADAIAARAVSKAGYDPTALADVFDRLNTSENYDLRFYDHPALGLRVASIRSLVVNEKLRIGSQGKTRYAQAVSALKSIPLSASAIPDKALESVCF